MVIHLRKMEIDSSKFDPQKSLLAGDSEIASKEESIERNVFVNEAEVAWTERRRKWVGDESKKPQKTSKEPIMSWTTTYEELFSSNEPFHQPIALAEMVDFLVEIWKEEGLYD